MAIGEDVLGVEGLEGTADLGFGFGEVLLFFIGVLLL
jgi:hypothetical protein